MNKSDSPNYIIIILKLLLIKHVGPVILVSTKINKYMNK